MTDARSFDPDATVALPIVPTDTASNVPTGTTASNAPTVALPTLDAVTVSRGGGAAPPPPDEPPAEASGDAGAGSVARNSATMAVGSLISRVTGFARTAVVGAAIGAELVGDDYNVANNLPNMVYELLLGGVLASVVVPLLVRARERDADRGEAYTQRLLTLAMVFLGAATVVAVAAAPLLAALMGNEHSTPADVHLTTVLGYLLLPEIFFYGVAAMIGAILNTRGHFAAPTWTPILNNVVVIGTALVFMLLPAAPGDLRADSLSTTQILVLGIGTTLGIVAQAAGLLPALHRAGFRWRLRWDFRALHLRELARVGSWMLGYVLVSQVGVIVTLKVANVAAAEAHAPGPAVYLSAYLIFMMAHGIVAVSILTALMPRMSAAAAEGRYADVVEQLSLGTRLSSVILVPATVAYVVLGPALGVTLFGYGRFGPERGFQTGWVIAVAGLGLVPFAISQLQLGVFYAMADTKTPAMVNIPVVALRVLTQALTLVVLPLGLVAAGLMGANGISYVLGALLGYWLLRRRVGRLGLRAAAGTLARLAVAAAAAAVPATAVVWGLHAAVGHSWPASLVQVVLGGLVLVAGYVVLAVKLRIREITDLGGMLRARLGR
jgi:putative peptidoglycan lipid II flippase